MYKAILRAVACACLLVSTIATPAQPKVNPEDNRSTSITAKPYKVLTNGRKITVQASSNIGRLMVWTASGHRILEQTSVNELKYSFEVPAKEKIVFILLELTNGKRYTEKVGVK